MPGLHGDDVGEPDGIVALAERRTYRGAVSTPIVRTWKEAAEFARERGLPPTEDDLTRFPDGRLVRTREDLAEFLALTEARGEPKDSDAPAPSHRT